MPNIETLTILHAVATGADKLAQKVGRFVTGAQFAFENPPDRERGIETDIIQRGNRSHLVAQAERGFIRIFAAHDAFFDDLDRLVQERHEHAIDSEARFVFS